MGLYVPIALRTWKNECPFNFSGSRGKTVVSSYENDGAADYILAMLLPRIEKLNPGLLDDLLAGAKADMDAVIKSGQMTAEVEQRFQSAIQILQRAKPM